MDAKDKILDLIERQRTGTSFVELVRLSKEFEGNKDILHRMHGEDVVIWSNVSESFANAILDLIQSRKAHYYPTTTLVYMCDGTMLSLPIYDKPYRKNRKNRPERWLPVVVNFGAPPSL